MMIFAMFMENTLFHGSVLAWALLLPFITLIIMNNDRHGLIVLTKDYLKAKSGNEIANQLLTLINLYNIQAQSDDA